jgi:hypothetical protein
MIPLDRAIVIIIPGGYFQFKILMPLALLFKILYKRLVTYKLLSVLRRFFGLSDCSIEAEQLIRHHSQ